MRTKSHRHVAIPVLHAMGLLTAASCAHHRPAQQEASAHTTALQTQNQSVPVPAKVSIELFPVYLHAGSLFFVQGCEGSLLKTAYDNGSHPHASVEALLKEADLHAIVTHSTSWRHDNAGMTLTYISVVSPPDSFHDGLCKAEYHSVPIARGAATAPPTQLSYENVLTHALRHLAWLARDDEHVAQALSSDWHTQLNAFSPTTFTAWDLDHVH